MMISFLRPNSLIYLFIYILFGARPPGVVSTANNGGFTSIRTKVKCNDFSWLLTSVWYMLFWSLFWTISLYICWQMILYRILMSLNHATIWSVCSIFPDDKTVKFPSSFYLEFLCPKFFKKWNEIISLKGSLKNSSINLLCDNLSIHCWHELLTFLWTT